MSPLHIAVKHGHIAIVKLLIQRGTDLNSLSSYGTPLYEAVLQSSMQCAKLLIGNGADINKTSKSKETPLHKSTELEYVNLIEVLIRAGADTSINLQKNQYTPLCVAAEHRKNTALQYLIKSPTREIDVVVGDGVTPLGIATQIESIEAMRQLIAAGADIDLLPTGKSELENESTLTPLMIAAKHGHRRAIELLLSKGARAGTRNQKGNSALHFAVFDHREDDSKDERKILKVCALLLKHKANPNVKNNLNVSPFYYALRRRMLSVVEMFLAYGSNPNERDQNESTAFHHLADCLQMYPLLAKYRADVNKPNGEGNTPLHIAASSFDMNPEQLENLVKEFRAQATPNHDGELPFHVAKRIENVQFFKTESDDLDEKTKNGDTLLHYAVRNRFSHLDVRKILKWKCAEPDAENDTGQTASDLAKLISNFELLRVFEEDRRERDLLLKGYGQFCTVCCFTADITL